jgi:hypothetical protein
MISYVTHLHAWAKLQILQPGIGKMEVPETRSIPFPFAKFKSMGIFNQEISALITMTWIMKQHNPVK